MKLIAISATEEERDDWTSEIRGAKTQLFVSLYATNPNSTLTSSVSTNHIRWSLQALPFPPSDDRLGTYVPAVSLSTNGKGRRRRNTLSYLDTGWEEEFLYEMWSKFWVATSLMWTIYFCVLLWRLIIHFRVDLISVSSPLIIF